MEGGRAVFRVLQGGSSTVKKMTKVSVAEGGSQVDGEGGEGGEEGEGEGTLAPSVLPFAEGLQEGEVEEEGLEGEREGGREGGRGRRGVVEKWG